MLAVGQGAPDFTLKDQNNQPVTLSSFQHAKNVLLERRPGGTEPMLLDLDRRRTLAPGTAAAPRAMLERLRRSLRKHAAAARRPLSAAEWAALARGAAGADA